MHFTILPAAPKTAQATIRALLASDASVSLRGVYRDVSRVPVDLASHPRFEAVQGDLADPASYAAHLKGTDGVFHVQPPVYDPERDLVGHTRKVSEGVKKAVEEGGARRLVVVSSMGAQYEKGTVSFGSFFLPWLDSGLD